jgi:hypothetical protein
MQTTVRGNLTQMDYAARPGRGNAARPGRGYAARPGLGNAARPGLGYAARPGRGNAARPGLGYAARPGLRYSSRPGSASGALGRRPGRGGGPSIMNPSPQVAIRMTDPSVSMYRPALGVELALM